MARDQTSKECKNNGKSITTNVLLVIAILLQVAIFAATFFFEFHNALLVYLKWYAMISTGTVFFVLTFFLLIKRDAFDVKRKRLLSAAVLCQQSIWLIVVLVLLGLKRKQARLEAELLAIQESRPHITLRHINVYEDEPDMDLYFALARINLDRTDEVKEFVYGSPVPTLITYNAYRDGKDELTDEDENLSPIALKIANEIRGLVDNNAICNPGANIYIDKLLKNEDFQSDTLHCCSARTKNIHIVLFVKDANVETRTTKCAMYYSKNGSYLSMGGQLGEYFKHYIDNVLRPPENNENMALTLLQWLKRQNNVLKHSGYLLVLYAAYNHEYNTS